LALPAVQDGFRPGLAGADYLAAAGFQARLAAVGGAATGSRPVRTFNSAARLGIRPTRLAKTKYRYNTLFQGVRVFLDNGAYDAKDTEGKQGYLEVYGRAKLEPCVRYRLT
jgi:hypothetical protein